MKLKLTAAIFTLLLCFLSLRADTYLDTLDRVDSAIGRGDWLQAEQCLRQALAECSDSAATPLLMSNLGMLQFYQGRDAEALATLNVACEMAPRAVVVLSNRAKVKGALGLVDEALTDYESVMQIDSTYVNAYFFHGMISLYGRRLPQAEADFRKLTELAADAEETAMAWAAYYELTEQPREALPHLRRLVEIDPTPERLARRAFCFLQLDYLSEAADDIAAGVEANPDNAELMLCSAILAKKRYEPEREKFYGRRAVELGIAPERLNALGVRYK